MADQNGSFENRHLERLNRMEDVIQGMIALTHVQMEQSAKQREESRKRHEEFMQEIRKTRDRQKE